MYTVTLSGFHNCAEIGKFKTFAAALKARGCNNIPPGTLDPCCCTGDRILYDGYLIDQYALPIEVMDGTREPTADELEWATSGR